jgi:hypothetical protein
MASMMCISAVVTYSGTEQRLTRMVFRNRVTLGRDPRSLILTATEQKVVAFLGQAGNAERISKGKLM